MDGRRLKGDALDTLRTSFCCSGHRRAGGMVWGPSGDCIRVWRAGPFFRPWDAGASLAEIHGTLGDIIMWLAGLHAAAAIFHHVFLRDRVLRRMLTGISDPSP
ncbi:cytochrome b [Mesorhizobium huakuii]|uniref:cytochrome b n=1 Tax=Mesorhizobium huakuii TaxID=28104 RepID=UPI003D799292